MELETATSLLLVLALSACATATVGDKSTSDDLKRFARQPEKVSLYVCREDTFNGRGIGTEAFVNGVSLGGLKTNTFTHKLLEPGELQIFLRRNGLNQNSGDSGTLKVSATAGEVLIIWAGPAGFMGPLTVDRFRSDAEARACVQKAEYVIK